MLLDYRSMAPFSCCVVAFCWWLVFPKVPEFPVFTRSGEVTVAISIVHDVALTTTELSRLYSFHHFIFHHVLRLEKLPMTFDPQHAETSNIVVPVNKGDVTFLYLSSANSHCSCEALMFQSQCAFTPWSRKCTLFMMCN